VCGDATVKECNCSMIVVMNKRLIQYVGSKILWLWLGDFHEIVSVGTWEEYF
jgi:hypothetical protein